jgi:hypothetical protein
MQQLELELQSRKEKEANSEKMKLMSENDPLKNLTTMTLPVPSYQLNLVKEFAQKVWEGCTVSVLEKEVVFFGVEQGCEEARRDFLIHMQVSYCLLKLLGTFARPPLTTVIPGRIPPLYI